jgi:hypothetical protein
LPNEYNAPGGDRWESAVSELRRQADDLDKRIDRSLP